MIKVDDLTHEQLREAADNLFRYDACWGENYCHECSFRRYCQAEGDIFSVDCCRFSDYLEDPQVIAEAVRQAEIDEEWNNAPPQSVALLQAIEQALKLGPEPKPINFVEFVGINFGGLGGDAV